MSLADLECQRYYRPWLAAHGSPSTVADQLSSTEQLDLQEQAWESIPSRDPILTAFAQNVALRLNTRRCMISLIDDTRQYVLAEATRSYNTQGPTGAGDEIWIGSAVLARPDAMCEHSLGSRCKVRGVDEGENGTLGQKWHTAEGMVVGDCRDDIRFSSRPYVLQGTGPRVRFYAGIPLLARNGLKIGVIAATDETPRDGLLAEELHFMQDMAQCAMTHLEWARDRVDRFKGERIVKGMATFIEHASSFHSDLANRPSNPHATLQQSATATELHDAEQQVKNSGKSYTGTHLSADSSCKSSDVFTCAADIMCEAALADGCFIVGAALESLPDAATTSGSDQNSMTTESHIGGKDRGTQPLARPCKVLSQSIAHMDASASSEQYARSPLSLATLYRYAEKFPVSAAFSLSDEAILVSASGGDEQKIRLRTGNVTSENVSEETIHSDEIQDNSSQPIDYEDLFQRLPGAKTVVFLPLFDPLEQKLVGGLILWARTIGKLVLADLPQFRAFADCIMNHILRANLERNEAAKTTFIASMSHELRSPLHGVLGAAEFLAETSKSAYETGLIETIRTCGTTLLETLSHILNHSKINNTDVSIGRGLDVDATTSTEQVPNAVTMVDLCALVEETAEAVMAGHTFQLSHSTRRSSASASASFVKAHTDMTAEPQGSKEKTASTGVTVLLDINPRHSWMVMTPTGAFQRIVMNILGNALKFTSAGFVALSLRALEHTDSRKVSILLRVVDSGKGISKAFQQDRLFVAFSQQDPFQPGTGLGLSIVKQIVDSLGGTIEISSSSGHGTQVDVNLDMFTEPSLPPGLQESSPDLSFPSQPLEAQSLPLEMTSKLAGKKLVLLDPLYPERTRSPSHQASRFQDTLRKTCEDWFNMRVSRSASMDDGNDDVFVYLYGEPPPLEMLRHHERVGRQNTIPVILACQNDHDATSVIRNQQKFLSELGAIVEVIQQPCGPRKLAKTFMVCLERSLTENGSRVESDLSTSQIQDASNGAHSSLPDRRPVYAPPSGESTVKHELRKSVSAAVEIPSPPPLDAQSPSLISPEAGSTSLDLMISNEARQQDHKSDNGQDLVGEPEHQRESRKLCVLIVDDNKINRSLLVMSMKKCNFTYREAENGQEAVDLFSEALKTTDATPARLYDYILMDISMPIMDGLEATRRIRLLEQDHGLEKASILALTGLASNGIREEASAAGIDVFLTKPIQFAELKKLLK